MSEQNVMDFSPEYAGEAVQGDGGDHFDGGPDDGAQGDEPAPGTGQSKSSKRRRRKRKKLAATGIGGGETSPESGTGAADGPSGAATYVPLILEGESLSLAASSAAQPAAPVQRRAQGSGGQSAPGNGQTSSQNNTPSGAQNGFQSNSQSGFQSNFQNNTQNGSQSNGQTQGKRWKKKFRDRERRTPGDGSSQPSVGFGGERATGGDRVFERPHRREGGRPDNFGNLVTHQHKTKATGGKDRGFVGPMDHSYREANPQFGDVPPSTIQLRGRRGHRQQGDGQPVDHNAPRALPIADDAQTHIYLFVEDLFITAKVQETARKLGVKVAFIKNEKEAIAELTSGEEPNRPSLIVFDLNNANAKPLTLIPKLKTKLKRSASIIGFLSMIQGDLKAKAVEAGCDTVMPKAAFSQNLPNLLRRYGIEEAEEVNFNY